MIDEDAAVQSCQLPLLSFFSFLLKKYTNPKNAVKAGGDAADQDLKARNPKEGMDYWYMACHVDRKTVSKIPALLFKYKMFI